MMKSILVLVIMISFSFGAGAAEKYKVDYLAVGMAEVDGDIMNHKVSEIERAMMARSVAEDAYVISKNENKLEDKEREYYLNRDGVFYFDDLLVFGLPFLDEVRRGEKSTRGNFQMKYKDRIVRMNIIRNQKMLEKMSNGDVVFFDLILMGMEEGYDGRWAGMGYEMWDVKKRIPLIRTFEIRRGKKIGEEYDLQVSYSESIID